MNFCLFSYWHPLICYYYRLICQFFSCWFTLLSVVVCSLSYDFPIFLIAFFWFLFDFLNFLTICFHVLFDPIHTNLRLIAIQKLQHSSPLLQNVNLSPRDFPLSLPFSFALTHTHTSCRAFPAWPLKGTTVKLQFCSLWSVAWKVLDTACVQGNMTSWTLQRIA